MLRNVYRLEGRNRSEKQKNSPRAVRFRRGSVPPRIVAKHGAVCYNFQYKYAVNKLLESE